MLKVYLSSTIRDLMPYRRAAFNCILHMGMTPLGQEDFSPLPQEALASSLELLQQADIFIGLYGHSLGIVPETSFDGQPNAAGRSLLEMEYEWAHTNHLPYLLFALSESLPLAPELAEPEGKRARLQTFKKDLLRRHVVTQVDSPQALHNQLTLGLSALRQALAPARADGLSQTDLETIALRAIEVYDAQRATRTQAAEAASARGMWADPIFGPPATNSQFRADIFMIMPFRPQYDAVYQGTVKAAIAELHLTIKRGDDFSSTRGAIIDEVWAAINACKLVVVECSEENANVYYELGIAHTLGKPAVLITQADGVEGLPFDLRHRRFIHYDDTPQGCARFRDELKHSIVWLLNDLDEEGNRRM